MTNQEAELIILWVMQAWQRKSAEAIIQYARFGDLLVTGFISGKLPQWDDRSESNMVSGEGFGKNRNLSIVFQQLW